MPGRPGSTSRWEAPGWTPTGRQRRIGPNTLGWGRVAMPTPMVGTIPSERSPSWSRAPHWKCGIRGQLVSRVRIPLAPPKSFLRPGPPEGRAEAARRAGTARCWSPRVGAAGDCSGRPPASRPAGSQDEGLLAEVHLPSIRFHDLRHTAATPSLGQTSTVRRSPRYSDSPA